MCKLLDAQDELSHARDMARLIAITARDDPEADAHAIAAGYEFIEERFEAAFRLLEEFKAEN